MKRKFFAATAVFIVIIGAILTPMFGFLNSQLGAEHAYAQIGPVTDPGGQSGGVPFADAENKPTTTETTTPKDATNIDNQANKDLLKCDLNLLCAIISVYSQLILFVPQLLASIAGMVLDWSMWHSLQSATYTSQDASDSFVVTGWKLVRDFSNLLFIFALFVIAFNLILNGTNYNQTGGLDPKRTFAWVIIMALLVNFSFFLCRVTIDVTNIAANMFYTKISAYDATGNTDKTVSSSAQGQELALGSTAGFYRSGGIRSASLGILDKINPQSLILGAGGNLEGYKSLKTFGLVEHHDWGQYVLLLFLSTMAGFFNFFLIYLFISVAILFLARTIGLFFFMILSPIAFVSVAIPKLKTAAWFGFNDWFSQFIGLAFLAPIFMFFFYLAIMFLKIAPTVGDATAGYLMMAAGITIKLLMIGLVLIFGKKIAKNLAGKVGEVANNVVTSLATGAAMVAGAAATGGMSGVAQLGKRYAAQKLSAGGGAVAERMFGKENYEAMQKSANWKAATSLKNYKPGNFNLQKQFQAITRVAKAGGVDTTYGDAYKYGKLSGRKGDWNMAKEDKEKKKAADSWKTWEFDKKLEDLKKDFDNGLLLDKEYNQRRKDILLEKKQASNPTAEVDKKINDLTAELKKVTENKAKLPPAQVQKEKDKIEMDIKIAQTKKANIGIKSTVKKLGEDLERSRSVELPLFGRVAFGSSPRKEQIQNYINRTASPESQAERPRLQGQIHNLKTKLSYIEDLDKNPNIADTYRLRGTGDAVKKQIEALEKQEQKLFEKKGLKEKIGDNEAKAKRFADTKTWLDEREENNLDITSSRDVDDVMRGEKTGKEVPVPPKTSLLTPEMRGKLKASGKTEEEISKLTLGQANNLLANMNYEKTKKPAGEKARDLLGGISGATTLGDADVDAAMRGEYTPPEKEIDDDIYGYKP